MFFVWLIFTAVCLCLYCCVLHIRTREACLVTYEATFSVSCLCVLRDHASRSPASVSVEASLPWLLFHYSCTSRDTRDVSMWWCHTAVSLQTTQPCLCHHSFVRPGGLYPCLENANSKAVPVRQKPQFRACIHCSSVLPVRAFVLLRGHTGYDSSCPWCQTSVHEGMWWLLLVVPVLLHACASGVFKTVALRLVPLICFKY